ncbi:MAG: flotillin-like protein FloA [Planctomycetes bacterium]|nr:flotillin-like protein FloA [Planctomycetota bacterium]
MQPGLFATAAASLPLAASGWYALIGILLVLGLVGFLIMLRYLGLWVRCLATKAGISIIDLVGMSLRKVNPNVIVTTKIMAVQAGIAVQTRDLESHYLAGGNAPRVVRALVAADRANIDLDFKTAAAIDLAGRDVLEAVQTSVLPKIIDCPNPALGRSTVDAVAKDGIQVRAKARVTVRANLERLVGGATEETIIARVGEGIVTTIGSSQSYKNVLENPDSISKRVLEKGLDAGTAFEILSIDIADVDVGDNIGAKLQLDQAESNRRMFLAEAEKRRAAAAAREQEMLALVQENRAKVVLAEAEVPKAIAEAFRAGHLGIMDYYRMKNIQADTGMRQNIGDSAKPTKSPDEP